MTGPLIVDGIFEARLVRENKSAKGIFWTIEIAADDYYRAKLENLRPNALLKLGYQELTDVSVQPIETPKGGDANSTGHKSASEHNAPPHAEQSATHGARKLSSQCALRCKDWRFWKWLNIASAVTIDSEDKATARVRAILNVKSRSQIDNDHNIGAAWQRMEVRFQSHLTSQMHAGSYR